MGLVIASLLGLLSSTAKLLLLRPWGPLVLVAGVTAVAAVLARGQLTDLLEETLRLLGLLPKRWG